MSDRAASEWDENARRPGAQGPEREHGIERIVVALDPSEHSIAALEAAARMAARLDAELLGLFVEDANVRRLAELSFVQEVGLFTARRRRIESHELTRQLRVQAVTMRQRFTVVTQRLGTRCMFREIRGRVVSEVVGAASEADVVILGKGAWSPFETERLAPAVREVLARVPASTLVLRAGRRVEPPLRVVYDGTPLAEKALAVASALVRGEHGHLMVLILADAPTAAARLQQEARERLEGLDLTLSFQQLTETSVSRLAYLVAHEQRGTLVLPANTLAVEDEAVLDFLDQTQAPVLIIR